MKRTSPKTKPSEAKAPPAPTIPAEFKPTAVRFEPTVIPEGNGSFRVVAGKPIIEQATDECGTAEAAKILGLSQNRVIEMCAEGIFREGADWRRPGGPRGVYFIKRSAVERQRNFTGERA